MQQNLIRLYEQYASNGCIERYLQHGLTWVKVGLSGVIDTALKSVKIKIHNMCEVVNVAKRNRQCEMAFSALIA